MKYIILIVYLVILSCKKDDNADPKAPLLCKDCRAALETTYISICIQKSSNPVWIDPHENEFPKITGNIGSLCDNYLKEEENKIYPGPTYKCDTDTLRSYQQRTVIKCWKQR
jgi:hypothetical protein